MAKVTCYYHVFICIGVLSFSEANPYTVEFSQGQFAKVNCSEISIEQSESVKEGLEIQAISYHTQFCHHSDIFGIANLCNGKESCSFNVTNTNIGSSCGKEESASLKITYKCIRDGGWSEWIKPECPVTCGGSSITATRTCNNPTPNKYGRKCKGDSVVELPCGTIGCLYSGQSINCTNPSVTWSCLDGYINVKGAVWWAENTPGCIATSRYDSIDVKSKVVELCNNSTDCHFDLEDSTFNVSCRECSILKYGYICEVAHWSKWSDWSSCSVSCGEGTKTRSRECKGSLDTLDGKKVGCNGSNSETSDCLEEMCPFCPVGNSTTAPLNTTFFNDTSLGTGYVQFGVFYSISCCARIVSWTFVPVNPGTLTIFILRKTSEFKYRIVGSNCIDVSVSDFDQQKTYDVPANESIGISSDDIIGWNDDGKNVIGYSECLDGNDTCPSVYRLHKESVDANTEIDIHGLQVLPNRAFWLNYTVSKNRKPDKSTTNEVITIPDHSGVDTLITMVSIYDPDVGDYVQNFKLDYANPYVYFDTQLRSIHVKGKLPHIVGKHNTSILYNITVEDTCNNTAEFEIMVIACNDPPTLKSVPSKITIDTATVDFNHPFSTFNITDPSNDNITCTITNNDTGHIILKQDGYDGVKVLSLFLVENYSSIINTSQSTTLELSCTDGTDTSNTNLTIDFKTGNRVEIVTSVPEKTSVIIPAVVSIVCACILIIIIVVTLLIKNKQKRKVQDERLDIVEYTKADEEIEKSKVQNCYAELGAASDLTVTSDKSNSQKHDDPSSGENAYNPAWR